MQQAQTLNILVSVGIKTREEARMDLGLAREGRGEREIGSQRLKTRPCAGAETRPVWQRQGRHPSQWVIGRRRRSNLIVLTVGGGGRTAGGVCDARLLGHVPEKAWT